MYFFWPPQAKWHLVSLYSKKERPFLSQYLQNIAMHIKTMSLKSTTGQICIILSEWTGPLRGLTLFWSANNKNHSGPFTDVNNRLPWGFLPWQKLPKYFLLHKVTFYIYSSSICSFLYMDQFTPQHQKKTFLCSGLWSLSLCKYKNEKPPPGRQSPVLLGWICGPYPWNLGPWTHIAAGSGNCWERPGWLL